MAQLRTVEFRFVDLQAFCLQQVQSCVIREGRGVAAQVRPPGGVVAAALRAAAMASSIAVSRPGAAPSIPRRDEVDAALAAL